MTAEQFRRHLRARYRGMSHADIGARLGLSAGFVGMILSGAREPSKKVLTAMGFERVPTYRKIKGRKPPSRAVDASAQG